MRDRLTCFGVHLQHGAQSVLVMTPMPVPMRAFRSDPEGVREAGGAHAPASGECGSGDSRTHHGPQ